MRSNHVSRGPAVRLGYTSENALLERAWEDALQGLRKCYPETNQLALTK